MTTPIEYAEMAGDSYISTMSLINRFPVPVGWTETQYSTKPSGFEAISLYNGTTIADSTQIVISFAGTDPTSIADWTQANIPLAFGYDAAQLKDAADYYLTVQALNPNATISFTGHSLGGGLAALMAVMFDQTAVTFDQAPFANAATASVAQDLLNYLTGEGIYSASQLQNLTNFISEANNATPGVIPNAANVTDTNVQGEVLTQLTGTSILGYTVNRIGNPTNITNIAQQNDMSVFTLPSVSLHSLALLTAFSQSNAQATTAGQTLNAATFQIADLEKMLFDTQLYANPTGISNTTKADFLQEIVSHQDGSAATLDPVSNQPQAALPADAMVTRFTDDLWKIAQPSGLTMSSNNLTDALVAFAMDKYYNEKTGVAVPGQELYTQITGGLSFDLANVPTTDAQINGNGYAYGIQHFNQYLSGTFDNASYNVNTVSLIESLDSGLRDWYVQAGSRAMNATDTSNVGAFMLGGAGNDSLTGGLGNNLLVAGTGNDTLNGGAGSNVLIAGAGSDLLYGGQGNATLYGGSGNDTFVYVTPATGATTETINDTTGNGTVYDGGTQITGNGILQQTDTTWVDSQGDHYLFDTATGALTISQGVLGANSGDQIVIDHFNLNAAQTNANGYLGIKFGEQLAAAASVNTADDPFTNGGTYTPATQAATVAVGNVQIVTLYASAASTTDQTVTLALSGGAGSYDISTGANLLPLGSPVNLIIPAGQDSATFTLVDMGNSSSVDTAQLSASLTDPNGTVTSNNLTVTFNDPATGITSATPSNTLLAPNYDAIKNGALYFQEYLPTGSNNLIVTGNANSYVYAAGGNDTISGGTGNDYLDELGANSLINGGGGQDVIDVWQGNNQIYANTQTDLATALAARSGQASGQQGSMITTYGGNNLIVGGNGNDAILTGVGNNTIVCGPGAVIVMGGVITNGLSNSSGSLLWPDGIGNFSGYAATSPTGAAVAGEAPRFVPTPWSITQSSNGLVYSGLPLLYGDSNVITPTPYHGNSYNGVPVGITNDTIFGGTGNSYYQLSNGNNYLDAGGGNDVISAGIGNNIIFGGMGNDTISGGGGDNYINTESGNDLIVAYGGHNIITGGTGNDTILSGDGGAGWATSEISANNYIDGGAGNSIIYGSGGNDSLIGGTGNASIYGGNGNEYIVGGDGNVSINGGNGNDTIYAGGAGKDTIHAGTGNTSIYGGNGSDYIVGGAGTDVISAGDGGTANAPTSLYAGSGTSTLYGGAGVDQLVGGTGFDTLIAGSGTSTLQGGTGTEVMYSGVGNATLFAGSGNDTLYGGEGNDILIGNSGNAVFVAGSGNETIYGGSGTNDYQFINGFGNIELGSTKSGDTFQFGAGISLADLTVSATIGSDGSDALLIQTNNGGSVIIDNGLNGAITQFAFADGSLLSLAQLMAQTNTTPATLATATGNVIFSAYGGDSLTGGTGNDTIYGWNGNDTLTAGSGNQTIHSESGHDLIMGGVGNDTLISAGFDTMLGGTGNTTFVVQSTTDLIQAQSTGSNINTVKSSVSYVLSANIQNLTLIGTAAISGTGNDIANTITANSGDDTLIAGTGIATLAGGTGNDTFIVNNVNDVVQAQSSGSNINKVLSSVNYVAPVNVQNLTLTGTADLTATGNGLNNVITANSGNDTLIGGAGNDTVIAGTGNDWLIAGSGLDTLIGGVGQDTFVVNNSNDAIIQQPNSGNSTVLASVNYVLPSNVDMLTLAGSANLAATGNSENDVITGNTGNDTLIAGSGNDQLLAGSGNDTLIAGSGDDTLVAGSGMVTMIGGVGDDTFVVNNNADVVQAQFTGTNTNTVLSLVSYSLLNAQNVQNLTLTGSANLNATGNNLDNIITANNGNDTLVAGSGNDTLVAGAGNSTLTGGTGLDTFVMGYGMGSNTLIDTSAQGDVIQLQAGLQLSDLMATQQGNDLLLQIAGTNTSFLLQGYYTNPQAWTVEDASSYNATVQSIVDATVQRASDLVTQSEYNYIAQLKATTISTLMNEGYKLQPDGSWNSGPSNSSSLVASYGIQTNNTAWGNWNPDTGIVSYSPTVSQQSTYWDTTYPYISDSATKIQEITTNATDPVIYANSGDSSISHSSVWITVSWSSLGSPEFTGSYGNPPVSGSGYQYAIPISGTQPTYLANGNLIWMNQWGTTSDYEVIGTPKGGLSAAIQSSPGNLTTQGPFPQAIASTFIHFLTTDVIQQINVGAGDHTIYGAGSNTLVNSSSGNDTIYNAGFAYGGTGNDTIIGSGGTQMAGTGNDLLIGGATMIAGSGNDRMFADQLAANLIVNANNTGVDVIGGYSDYSYAVLNAFYTSQGIANWGEGYSNPNQYSYVQPNGKFDQITYANAQDAATVAAGWGLTLQQAVSDGRMNYIVPLPVVAIVPGSITPSTYYATSNTPQVTFSANDYQALAPYYAQGIIPTNRVQLGAGIVLANLTLSWGVMVGSISGQATDPQLRYTTLDISSGPNNPTLEIMIPHGNDSIGSGVTEFDFADGTKLNIAQLIAMAPPAPTFDPQILHYQLGMGAQTLSAGYSSIQFGAGITSGMVTLGVGPTGSLMLRVGPGGDVINIPQFDPAHADQQSTSVQSFGFADGTSFNYEQLLTRGFDIYGTTGNETLTGTNLDNRIYAGTGNDVLIGSGANDILIAGAGLSTMIGGTGNETFMVNNVNDVIRAQSTGSNTNIVLSSVSYVTPVNVQTLTLTGTASLTAAGNSLNDILTANSGNDTLIAGTGLATLVGGTGNDTFVVNNANDVIQAQSTGTNTNTVLSSVSHAAPANVQNITLTGTADLTATGNALDNVITANSGNDTLIAGSSNATLIGGAGVDTFVINQGGTYRIIDPLKTVSDIIQFGPGITASMITLGLGSLMLRVGSSGEVVHIMDFNPADALAPNAIQTFRFADGTSLSYDQLLARGFDIYGTTGNETLSGTNLDNRIYAGSGNDTLIGTGANDTLVAGVGTDTLIGGSGNETFVVNNSADVIVAAANAASNTIEASFDYVAPAHVQNITLTGTANLTATGNTLNNTLTGNAGNDTLIGGSGNDTLIAGSGLATLIGGTGSNVFVVDNINDVVSVSSPSKPRHGSDSEDEHAKRHRSADINTILSSVNYVLPADVQNLTLTGMADLTATGNNLNDELRANRGNDTLIAGSGWATLVGGTGNDTFVVNSARDVIEAQSTGSNINTVVSSLSYVAPANVQNVTLTGTADLLAVGNHLNNILRANSGNDTLIAGSGLATLIGGSGNDTFVVNNANDIIQAQATGTNTNSILSSVSYVAPANVQDITLTGSANLTAAGNNLDNVIYANRGNDTLTGGSGLAILIGGQGHDMLTDTQGQGMLLAGSGKATLTGGAANDFIAAGRGNEVIIAGATRSVIAINRDAGRDTIVASPGGASTLSLGGGINMESLSLSRDGNDLVLSSGDDSRITLQAWYANTANHDVTTLQLIGQSGDGGGNEAGWGHPSANDSGSHDKINEYDFSKLVALFDQARAVDPGLSKWHAMDGMLSSHLSSSDTAALGGDLAYYYGTHGQLSGMSLAAAQSTLHSPQFGVAAQTIHSWTSINQGTTLAAGMGR
ncbi:MAG: lipase family protein [Sulfuriferula sp.]